MYTYIYYKLYRLAKKTEKNWSPNMRMPATIAMFSITILQFVNLMTLYVFIVHGIQLFKPFILNKGVVIIITLILYGINYYYFLFNEKFKYIENKLDKESSNLKSVKSLFFWLYIIFSFILLFYMFEKFKTIER